MNPNVSTSPPTGRRRAPIWAVVLLTLVVLTLLLAIAFTGLLSEFEGLPVRIVIDGNEVLAIDPAGVTTEMTMALGFGLAIALVLLLVVVPLALLLAVGVPLLLALVVVALVLSPVWLAAWLIVSLWRKSATPGRGQAAKIT